MELQRSRRSRDFGDPSVAASFPAQSSHSTGNPTFQQPNLTLKTQIYHSNHQIPTPLPVSKLPQATGSRNLGIPHRSQRNQWLRSKRSEHLLAATPAANQAAAPATESPTDVAPTSVASSTQERSVPTNSPAKRSWVDVVRRSAVASEEIHRDQLLVSTGIESFASSGMVVNEKLSPSSAAKCSLEKGQDFEPGLKLGELGDLQHQAVDSGVCPKLINTSSLSSTIKFQNQSEQSRAFKSWARGRCYRCLAHGHQVRSCRDSFRCIRCQGPGHRARFCHLRIVPSSPQDLYLRDLQCPQATQSYQQSKTLQLQTHQSSGCEADTKSSHHCSPSQGHQSKVPSKVPISIDEKVANNVKCSYQWLASLAATSSLDSKSMVTPLLDALRSELEHLLETHLERLMRPIREELCSIKNWLARVATLADCGGQKRECVSDGAALNTAELFGPFSPAQLSSTSAILESLTAANKSNDRLACKRAMVGMAEPLRKICQETPLEQNVAQFPHDSQENHMLKQTVSRVEDSSLLEDALDKKIVSYAHTTVISSSDDSQAQPIDEVMVEESHASDDSLMKTSSSLDNSTTKRDVLSSSPKVATTRHGRRLCDKVSRRRSSRSTQRNILKDLGFVRKNGELDEDKLQVFADLLKDLLPKDLLLSLMSLKGRVFWEAIAEIFGPLC